MAEEVLEYCPLDTSLSKLVDFQGQPLDTSERMESSFMDFLEHVRIRAIESGTDMCHIEDKIVALVQSADEYQQVKQFVSELMNRNQELDVSLSDEREFNLDYELKARQLEHELQLMREQMECVIWEADQTNELLDLKDGREKQLVENQMNAATYRIGLEQENTQLLSESRALKQEVSSADKKERALIRQCFDQLGSANRRIELLDTESRMRENANYVLEGKVQELTDAVRQMQEHQSILWEENTKLKEHLYSTYESHSRVAGHVLHLQSVNEEYKAMLGDTQSQLHELKSKTDILNSSQIPLSSEIESALHSTPEENSPNCVIGIKQQLFPVHRPISPLVSNQICRESSDSDSFVCKSDTKRRYLQSERSRGKRPNIPKSKSVTFLDISDTESTDEDPYGTKIQHTQVTNISSHSPFSPQLPPKSLKNRKLLSHHDNVKLVKNVEGSVHLEKWRNLASLKNDLIDSGPGIKLKSKQKYGGSLENISAFFNDSKSPQQIETNIEPKKTNNNNSPNQQDGLLNNWKETISQWWKWKN